MCLYADELAEKDILAKFRIYFTALASLYCECITAGCFEVYSY